MSFYSNNQIHQLYQKNHEGNYLPQSFDHSKPPLTGWRAERKAAEIAQRKSKPAMKRKLVTTVVVQGIIQYTKAVIIWVNGRAFN
jgi:hypothetical protein